MELTELQIAILEIVLAGAIVLRNSYGFDEEQIDNWLAETNAEVFRRRAMIDMEIASAVQKP